MCSTALRAFNVVEAFNQSLVYIISDCWCEIRGREVMKLPNASSNLVTSFFFSHYC